MTAQRPVCKFYHSSEAHQESKVSRVALTDFHELLRKHHAVASCLPSNLHQGAIHVAHNAHDRHLFAVEMNFAATWISYPFNQSRCIHHGLSPARSDSNGTIHPYGAKPEVAFSCGHFSRRSLRELTEVMAMEREAIWRV